MSQKLTGSDAQKGFAVGRGLLAAAETLNFSMGESHSDPYGSSSQSHSGMSGLGGGEGKDHDSQLHRRAGSHISNTMKLFASLGLSPTDLDALAQVPEENISVETLPHLIMQLKNRKMEAGRHIASDLPSLSSETSYRGGRDDWGDMQGGRLDRPSGQAQSRSQGDFGYTSMQETSGRGYDMLDYRSGSGRDRQYSELSRDSYRNLGMSTSSTSDDMFMQRRMGSPSQRKVQDFLGVMPLMFPHVCSLCDFDVHSVMEWTQHTTGIRHSENRKLLLQMYPDWDPQMPSSRMSTSLSMDSKSRSDGLLGPAPVGGGLQRTGMSSSWGSDSSVGMTSKMTSYAAAPKIRSRVVVAKYERKPMSTNSLFDLAKPFGTICEHLILKNKAFLELQTHEEALAMANYYQRKPAILHGKEIHIYLSKELMAIEKSGRPGRDTRPVKRGVSQVVFFSNLPRGSDKKMELLTISRRFGTVEKHLFLNDEAFVQMGNAEDAEMLVKYYTVNPLTINGRSIRLNICTKYKTLTVPPGKGDQGREEPARKSSGSSSVTSRTGDKPSSKNQRSSTSKARESSNDKEEEPKPEEVEALGDRAGDEADVMEARDGDEEGFDEDPSADDVDLSCDPEQTSEQAPDIDDANIEDEEDPEAQQARNESSEETTENQKDSGEKQEETPLEEPTTSEAEQENTDELPKDPQEQNDDQPEDEGAEEDNEEQDSQTETDFPENMDEFVTLDELGEEEEGERQDSKSNATNTSGSSKDSGGLRVVNVVGFKRGYGYLDEILNLAKPFGKVVRHLVLDVRPEAFLEFSNEQEARAMVSFYSGNVLPSVCGKPVKVFHSHTYATIQSGRVIYIGNVPPFKGSDASLLKIAEPFGNIRRYFLNPLRNECFIEMERGEDAEKMAEAYKENRPKFEGKRLVVYVSRKYKQLKRGQRPPSPETEDKRTLKRERSGEDEAQRNSSGKSKDKKEEEPSVKKIKVDEPVADKAKEMESHEEKESQNVSAEIVPEEKKESEEKQSEDTSELQNMETEPEAEDEETVASEKSVKTEEKTITTAPSELKLETSHSTLEPYDPNVPVGVEFVKMGYYCRICFLFYSNEDTAKKIHCSSQAHYDKLKKYLEKEKAKAQSNGTKK
ncbi:matrin-3-like [Rhinichthys klamathensis goyatoka]|uniref:matrin-3-like n=1 Tax=Rhinichthys klamathensis goyatoka TaxID=3034132 RepID=UPI0024B54A47|nr:matrin-3-like [Rhinichthys klamathensis goyatoka]XP_056106319.1 matrin-3-like [Rhinichthys klamathensis goyatoka]